MRKFIVCEDFFKSISKEESKEVYDFFRQKKYINSRNELTVRFFMYYMNHYIELPINLENKRSLIFKDILTFNFNEEDSMAAKSFYKKKPYGFKDED